MPKPFVADLTKVWDLPFCKGHFKNNKGAYCSVGKLFVAVGAEAELPNPEVDGLGEETNAWGEFTMHITPFVGERCAGFLTQNDLAKSRKQRQQVFVDFIRKLVSMDAIKLTRKSKLLLLEGKPMKNTLETPTFKSGRLKRKLTLQQLSDKTGISVSYLSEIENGVKQNPSPDKLKKLKFLLR